MPTILVVDDQQCVRELVAEELGDEGYDVETVGDARLAKTHIKSFKPDLVLLDLYLEGPDGWHVLQEMKKQAPFLPVIVFTAYDSFKDDPRLSEAEAYVIKSTDFSELKETVARALATSREPQGDVEPRAHVPTLHAVQSF